MDRQLILQFEALGEERFQITEATYNIVDADGFIEFTISIECGEAISRVAELEEVYDPDIALEATALLQPNERELKAGQIIRQHEGYDHKREENLSNMLYFSHEAIDELEVHIHAVDKDGIVATVSAVTTIESGEHDARLLMENVRFVHDPELERGVM
jgi:hypothetical protein